MATTPRPITPKKTAKSSGVDIPIKDKFNMIIFIIIKKATHNHEINFFMLIYLLFI